MAAKSSVRILRARVCDIHFQFLDIYALVHRSYVFAGRPHRLLGHDFWHNGDCGCGLRTIFPPSSWLGLTCPRSCYGFACLAVCPSVTYLLDFEYSFFWSDLFCNQHITERAISVFRFLMYARLFEVSSQWRLAQVFVVCTQLIFVTEVWDPLWIFSSRLAGGSDLP